MLPNVWLKKSLSQHFLKEVSFGKRIVDSMGIQNTDRIVEIGPGDGVLTEWLMKSSAYCITAVELDKRLYPFLLARFGNDKRFHLVESDFLKVDLAHLSLSGEKVRIVGNLPYAITSPILFRILDQRSAVEDITVTVQKEVAERLVSPPGAKSYGIPSVLFQLHSNTEILFNIPKKAFFPVPKVDSAVLRIRFRKNPVYTINNPDFFQLMLKSVFSQRRKMLRNTLKKFVHQESNLDRVPLDLTRRPETLTIKEFIELSDFLSS